MLSIFAFMFATVSLMDPVQVHPGQTWFVRKSQDEISDKVHVVMQLEDTAAGWSFGFLCSPGEKLALGVLLKHVPNEPRGINLLPSRVDAQPMRLDQWDLWGLRASLADRDKVPAYFSSREKLIVRFTRLSGDKYDIVGNMSGSDGVRAKFIQACAEIGAPIPS